MDLLLQYFYKKIVYVPNIFLIKTRTCGQKSLYTVSLKGKSHEICKGCKYFNGQGNEGMCSCFHVAFML